MSDPESSGDNPIGSWGDLDGPILYALGSGQKTFRSEASLQRVLFLVSRELPHIVGDSYRFEYREDGPYSERISEELEGLLDSGMVDWGLNLTDSGRNLAERTVPEESMRSSIDFWVDFVQGLTETEILTFIRVTFPDTAMNSDFRTLSVSERIDVAVSLVAKYRISVGKGAEIAGVGYPEFEGILRDRGVGWKGRYGSYAPHLRDPCSALKRGPDCCHSRSQNLPTVRMLCHVFGKPPSSVLDGPGAYDPVVEVELDA